MKQKIFNYMCFLISISVICTFLLTLTLSYPLFFENTKGEVRDESTYLTYVFNHRVTDPIELLKSTHTQTRITWIDSNGVVLDLTFGANFAVTYQHNAVHFHAKGIHRV